MQTPTPFLFGLSVILMATGCVTQNKYDRLQAAKVDAEARAAECNTQLTRAQQQLQQLRVTGQEQEEQLKGLRVDTTELGTAYRRTRTLYTELNNTYEQLLRNNDRLLSSSASEKSKLSADLRAREQALLAAEKTLQESRREINQLEENLQAREQRVEELEQLIAEKDARTNELRERVAKALLGFDKKDLTVNIKDGNVYVSLSEQLLFSSGSYAVNAKGREAIRSIAPILRDQEDILVHVQGHTDDVPLKESARMKDNWDLSVLRATSVARILDEAGVPGAKLEAAGRSKYQPLAEGETAAIRQKNRRTEIILEPDLSQLYEIIEKD